MSEEEQLEMALAASLGQTKVAPAADEEEGSVHDEANNGDNGEEMVNPFGTIFKIAKRALFSCRLDHD